MDGIITDKSTVTNNNSNGSDNSVEIQQRFVVNNSLKVNVTVVEANGNSVVLLKDAIAQNMSDNLHTGLNAGNVAPEVVTNVGTGATVKSQQSNLTLPDVGFTSLLSKHLYSTTMTGSSSQSNDLIPEVKNTNNVASKKENPPVVMLTQQNPINVVHPDLLRMGSLLNNQNLIVGNGQNLPQIIYVPIIAAPPVAQPSGSNEVIETTVAASAGLSPVAPINYGMIGALPLNSSANNIGNLVYVQPQIPPTPVINPTLQQTSTLLNTATTSTTSLLNIVQQQPSLLNLAVQPPASLLNFAVQPQTPLLNLALQNSSTLVNTADVRTSETTQALISASTLINEQKTVITTADNKKRGQKRKLSRNKSCSSDASSVDSSIIDGPSQRTGLIKQSTVSSKKIERVRKTVNTEEELNTKVSGLVSKILSQFPKTPPQQQNSKPRFPAKASKRMKPENNNHLSLPNALNSDSVPNMMIPSTVVLAEEENAVENSFTNEGNELPHSVVSSNETQNDVNQTTGNSSINSYQALQTGPFKNQEINNSSASVSEEIPHQNAQVLSQKASVRDKPLVSRIELTSILPSATVMVDTSYTQPTLMSNHDVLKIPPPTETSLLSNSDVVIQSGNGQTSFLPNPAVIVQSALGTSPVIGNPAVIVESAPGQIPLEYVQIVEGNISDNVDHSFAVQEVSVSTVPAEDYK